MKFLRVLWINIKILMRAFLMIGAVYILVPVLLSLFFGYISSAASGDFEIGINMDLVDEDHSDASRGIKVALEALDAISFHPDEDYDVKVIIPEGYEKMLMGRGDDANIVVDPSGGGASAREISKRLMDQFGKTLELSYQLRTADRGFSEKQGLIAEMTDLASRELKVERESIFVDKGIDVKMKMGMSFLSYSFLMMMATIPASMKLARTTGLKARELSLPTAKETLLFYDYISGVLTCMITGTLYIGIHRLLHVGFSGSLLQYLGTIAAFSMVYIAASYGVVEVFGEKIGSAMIQFMSIVQIFSASFVTSGMMDAKTNVLGKIISALRIDKPLIGLLERTYTGTWDGRSTLALGVVIGVGIALFGLSYFLRKQRKEVLG